MKNLGVINSRLSVALVDYVPNKIIDSWSDLLRVGLNVFPKVKTFNRKTDYSRVLLLKEVVLRKSFDVNKQIVGKLLDHNFSFCCGVECGFFCRKSAIIFLHELTQRDRCQFLLLIY